MNGTGDTHTVAVFEAFYKKELAKRLLLKYM